MNPETCALLAQLYPLFLITVALERRIVSRRTTKKGGPFAFGATLAGCLVGISLSVVGTALGGLESVGGVFNLIVFFGTLVALALILVASAVIGFKED